MPVFQFMDAGSEGVGSVVGEDGAGRLEDDVAGVVAVVDIMDGNAALLFAGSKDSFVDMMPVHAFAAISGEQGGMDVDYAVGIGCRDTRGNEPEEAGEDDEVRAFVLQSAQQFVGVAEFLTGKDTGGDLELPRPFQDVGSGNVAINLFHAEIGLCGEISDDIFGVRT